MTENNNIVIYQSEDGNLAMLLITTLIWFFRLAIKQRGEKQKQIKFILIEENNSPEPPI